MEVNSTKSDLMAKFLARQDMPKPTTSPLVEAMKEDTFVSSKDNSQPLEAQAVKSDDTFVKSEQPEISKEEVKSSEAEKNAEAVPVEKTEEVKAEEPKAEEQQAQEVKEVSETEEVKDEVSEEEKADEEKKLEEENVTKKPTVLDKIKGFFKNLFMKLKPKKNQVDVPTANSSAGSTN